MLNRVNTIDIIDFAVDKTKESFKKKHQLNPSIPEIQSGEYFYNAIKYFLANYNDNKRANYFTKNDNARFAFGSLKKEEIYAELLKNIIKMDAFRNRNGYNVALAAKPNYEDCVNPLEKEKWLYRQIMYTPLEYIDTLIQRNELILDQLIISFVDDRYFSNFDRKAIDDAMNLNKDENSAIYDIENYYKKNTYNY